MCETYMLSRMKLTSKIAFGAGKQVGSSPCLPNKNDSNIDQEQLLFFLSLGIARSTIQNNAGYRYQRLTRLRTQRSFCLFFAIEGEVADNKHHIHSKSKGCGLLKQEYFVFSLTGPTCKNVSENMPGCRYYTTEYVLLTSPLPCLYPYFSEKSEEDSPGTITAPWWPKMDCVRVNRFCFRRFSAICDIRNNEVA